jgi:hypothetical protein
VDDNIVSSLSKRNKKSGVRSNRNDLPALLRAPPEIAKAKPSTGDHAGVTPGEPPRAGKIAGGHRVPPSAASDKAVHQARPYRGDDQPRPGNMPTSAERDKQAGYFW